MDYLLSEVIRSNPCFNLSVNELNSFFVRIKAFFTKLSIFKLEMEKSKGLILD